MMMLKTLSIALLLAASALTPVPALADGPVAARSTAAEQAKHAADRAAILAMAGNYKVTFDMRETTPWRADYTPLPPKTSGGHEVVRVIEDSDRKIVLQHILVVDVEGKTVLVKHWRQDWIYEPAPTCWSMQVPRAMEPGGGARADAQGPLVADRVADRRLVRATVAGASGRAKAACRAGAATGHGDRSHGAMPMQQACL
jgi:hypothetical protein